MIMKRSSQPFKYFTESFSVGKFLPFRFFPSDFFFRIKTQHVEDMYNDKNHRHSCRKSQQYTLFSTLSILSLYFGL